MIMIFLCKKSNVFYRQVNLQTKSCTCSDFLVNQGNVRRYVLIRVGLTLLQTWSQRQLGFLGTLEGCLPSYQKSQLEYGSIVYAGAAYRSGTLYKGNRKRSSLMIFNLLLILLKQDMKDRRLENKHVGTNQLKLYLTYM